MSVIEEIDALAAEGRLCSVDLCRVGDMWQCSLQSAVTGGYTVLRKSTPSEALAATLKLLPICEAYDKQHGLVRPVEEPKPEPVGIFD